MSSDSLPMTTNETLDTRLDAIEHLVNVSADSADLTLICRALHVLGVHLDELREMGMEDEADKLEADERD